jgi:hypothetical protein
MTIQRLLIWPGVCEHILVRVTQRSAATKGLGRHVATVERAPAPEVLRR